MFRYLEKKCFPYCSKLVINKRWVMEIVRQRVAGHRANNRKCPMIKLVVTLSWNDELVVAGRAKMLTASDIRSKCGAIHRVLGSPALKTLVNGHSKLILEYPASAGETEVTVTGHDRTS